jgi:hypothetical protein
MQLYMEANNIFIINTKVSFIGKRPHAATHTRLQLL